MQAVRADAENGLNAQAARAAAAGGAKGLVAGAGSRRALGDIGNLVGGFSNKVQVGKEQAGDAKAAAGRPGVLTRRAAAQLAAAGTGNGQAGNPGSWGAAKPRNGLRPRDSNVPVVSQAAGAAAPPAEKPAPAGRSMSQLLHERSEAALIAGKTKEQCVPALPDIDSADAHDPLAATDFVADIFSYYKRVEPQLRVAPDYMSRQTDINEKMRAILIDWLVDVHLKFKLMPETLYLTVNLIDRFLEAKQVTRKHLQLVGVTAMLVASKYEEIWAPEVRDFVYISDRAYTRDQILNMEKIMLNCLRFNLTVPSIYNFLGRNFKAAGVTNHKEVTLLATYLVELSLVDYGSLKFPYSQIAVAATYVAQLSVGMAEPYSHALQRHSGYTLPAIMDCAQHLASLMRKAPNTSLVAVYKKYSSEKMQKIALTYEAPAALLAQQ
ncbi:hypothetical protein ABPG77_007406 [Micractinium sp. CCAP 211/92]